MSVQICPEQKLLALLLPMTEVNEDYHVEEMQRARRPEMKIKFRVI